MTALIWPMWLKTIGLRILYPLGIKRSRYYELVEREAFFRKAFQALRYNEIDGDYVEFGTGPLTFPLAFRESRRQGYHCKLWAFDSFAGLPGRRHEADEHPHWLEGQLRTELQKFIAICRRNRIATSDYEVVSGYFDETLENRVQPSNICLAYVDCDMYTSALSVLGFLKRRLKHGMIIAFDDYYCWSNRFPSGERKAFLETLQHLSVWKLVPYLQYGWSGMSFVVEAREAMGAHAEP